MPPEEALQPRPRAVQDVRRQLVIHVREKPLRDKTLRVRRPAEQTGLVRDVRGAPVRSNIAGTSEECNPDARDIVATYLCQTWLFICTTQRHSV